KQLNATLIQPRTHEINLRFDTPDQSLSRSYQVLRLRQDQEARLTYKGPGEVLEGVRIRREIEFSVSDFRSAQSFLEALGYQVIFMYEKYRSVYDFNDMLVMLDEMPVGYFLELEGANPEIILSTSQILGLRWETRILDSYTVLFDRVRQSCGLNIRDLSFDNFRGIEIKPEMMDLVYAEAD
ncbi:MAG: class IV adenylate cyclase, partial [Anaerolineaceae bacterium]